jgi:AcrR family transcriptional regulator
MNLTEVPAREGPLTRKELKARTRLRLMRSAAAVFARRGMNQASIDEVAADAGYTKGAFYANFSSKQELFLAMLDERFAERLAQIKARYTTDSAIEEQARAAGEDFARYLSGDRDWQRLFFEFVAQAARDESFRLELVARYGALRDQIAGLFTERARELGLDLPLAADDLATMTFAMANGFALERMIEPEATGEELFGRMLVVFFAGLRALAQEAGTQARTGRDDEQSQGRSF